MRIDHDCGDGHLWLMTSEDGKETWYKCQKCGKESAKATRIGVYAKHLTAELKAAADAHIIRLLSEADYDAIKNMAGIIQFISDMKIEVFSENYQSGTEGK